MVAQIITVAQHKGGAGKTTLLAHLAVAWAETGQRVAILDTDPQASLETGTAGGTGRSAGAPTRWPMERRPAGGAAEPTGSLASAM